MGTLFPEKSLTNREMAMEKLINGRDFATQLQILLQNPQDGSVSSAEELALKILSSFTDTLSMLNSSSEYSGDFCRIPPTAHRMSENSGESGKRPAVKGRRGCYKRSRKTSADSWVKVSPSVEDGYAWRKYGQKGILNAKFPRCYFRCTHKHGQGCKAIKQVQRVQEEPQMYQTTYFGHHTCTNDPHPVRAPQETSESDHVESYLISFESKAPVSPSTKEEFKEEAESDISQTTSLLDWPDLMPLEPSGSGGVISSSDNGLDVEFWIKSVDLDNCFHFDEGDLLY